MHELFSGEYAPITNEIGFIDCSPEEASAAFLEWQRPLQARRGIQMESMRLQDCMESAMSRLLPLTSVERRRFLFLHTRNNWTAFLDNGWRGTDVFSQVSYLCGKLGCRGVRIGFVSDAPLAEAGAKVRYGARIFELYGPKSTDFMNIERSIASANDGGRWKFSQGGVVQSFEDIASYKARSAKEKFTGTMLAGYAKALGIDAFDESYYQPEKGYFLISKVGPCAENASFFSLKEAMQQ